MQDHTCFEQKGYERMTLLPIALFFREKLCYSNHRKKTN